LHKLLPSSGLGLGPDNLSQNDQNLPHLWRHSQTK